MISTRFPQALVACAIAFLAFSPACLADETVDIGYVDQTALAGVPSVREADRQLTEYKNQLAGQLSEALRSASTPADQQRIAQQFQAKLLDRQRLLLDPLLKRAQIAIASVASSKNLSVVVDKRIVIMGGQDITGKVVDLLGGLGDPVPPVSTPPPSDVGFVDQAKIEAVPKLKAAMDAFSAFRGDQQQRARTELSGSKTDADRRRVLEDFQKRIAAEQKQKIDPLVDQTRSAITDVAKEKKLLLVIDRNDVIYGGTDITPEVAKNLGG